MKIVTVDQMQLLEQKSADLGVSIDTFMENAGLAVAREAGSALGSIAGSRVLALTGPGNNGGDALVAARHLQRWGAMVTSYQVPRRRREDPKLTMALESGVAAASAADDPDMKNLDRELAHSRLVIDGVLGTGHARPLEGPIRELLLRVGAFRDHRPDMTVMALDLPSGLNADSGQVDAACPRADITVTLGYPKVGHFKFPGAKLVGNLKIVDIGIPDHLAEDINLELLNSRWVKNRLPPRPLNAHKGTFGHALIIAGSRNYVGAAYLAAQSATRVGPGLVTLAAPQSIYPILASKLTEVIHLPLPDDGDGKIHPDAAALVRENLHKYSSMLVGCGFDQSDGLVEFLRTLLLEAPKSSLPLVIDADGLANLAKIDGWWKDLTSPTVLTPHPGEMSVLTGLDTSEIQANRTETALEWSARWGKVVALKGAYTAIAGPEGVCRVNPFANPGLASGGTGDVLSGVIAGFMTQGLTPEDAACCGAYLHGVAGEVIRDELGDAGILAGDLLAALPKAITAIKAGER